MRYISVVNNKNLLKYLKENYFQLRLLISEFGNGCQHSLQSHYRIIDGSGCKMMNSIRYTSTQVKKYNVKVDNQNNKTKFDSKNKIKYNIEEVQCTG